MSEKPFIRHYPRDTYVQRITVPFEYPVTFTRGLFTEDNPVLVDTMARLEPRRRHRALVYVDAGVDRATPGLLDRVAAYFDVHADRLELVVPPQVTPGGEEVKVGWAVVEGIMRTIGDSHLCRQSFVVAVGGGSVLDMVGFASSIVHRGLRFVRVPTTVLAQNDAGVGVKNGMNEHGVKNYVGTFAPPFAVLNDAEFLRTLEQKYWVGGIAEAFKVAVIKDAEFLTFLCTNAAALRDRNEEHMETLIRRCAMLHLDHIRQGGDPFEFGSARPLDFGHWASHRLEVLSAYELGHGQAVAIGIALDAVYAFRRGLLAQNELARILGGLVETGLPVWSDHLERRDPSGRLDILKGLDDFREHLGGELTVTLPRGVGRKCEVHEMDTALIENAVAYLKDRFAA
jgi:3-dehydroquinate synthase